jgi:hypothetical protein
MLRSVPMNEAGKMAPRGHMTVKRLLDTDSCPCGKKCETTGQVKLFAECCRGELKPGMTAENTLHMLFEETDESSKFYAFQSQKMSGEVPADEIVTNIGKRLWSPPVQRALDRLTWYAVREEGTSSVFSMVPEPIQTPPAKALLDSSGNPIKAK